MLRQALVFPILFVSLWGCSDPEVKRLDRQIQLDMQGQKLGSILGEASRRISDGEDALTIQLTFGADADLDLYVTDPLLETVYFANHQGKSGGRISEDVRCELETGSDERESEESGSGSSVSGQSRIEEVRFDSPLPGRYRIGIDYPTKCEGGEEQAAFAVSVLHNGERVQKLGAVSFERFEVVVMEFEI